MKRQLALVTVTSVLLACSAQKKGADFPKGLDMQGHRGSRGLMPENTIPAMRKAIDMGATTLEMDLCISGDKQVVVSHDTHFHENITTTPDGATLTKAEAAKRLLYAMPYNSIKKYDVGLKPHPDFPRQQKLAVHKPLLADLLTDAEAYAKGQGCTVYYNIEIKSKPEGDGKKHPPVEEFVDLAMAVINGKGIAARTTVQAFDPRALQVVHRKYPGVVTSLLIEGTDKRTLDEQLQALGYTPPVYSPHFSLVTAGLVEACHKKGIRVVPWTVNTIEEMRRLKSLKVDGIITDYPDLFAQL